jgi:hypothetical protein
MNYSYPQLIEGDIGMDYQLPWETNGDVGIGYQRTLGMFMILADDNITVMLV